MRFLKQSTSVDLPVGPFLDATDGVTAETTLTITQADIRLKKNGGAWAQKAAAQTLSHEENGNYELTLDATDTDTLGLLRLHIAESGAVPVWDDFMVMPANVWDSLFGADKLQVDATQIEGSDATDQIRDAIVDDATRIDASALNTASTAIGSDGTGLTEAGGTGDHLTAINLPDQTMNITGNITGNLSGSVGSVTGAVGSVTGNVGGNVTGSVGSVAAGGIANTSFAAGALDAAAAATDFVNEVADGVLNRDMSTGTDSGSATVRTPRQALRLLRNKVSIAAGTLTVTKEDDTTSSWTAEVTTTAGDPIDSIDPASA